MPEKEKNSEEFAKYRTEESDEAGERWVDADTLKDKNEKKTSMTAKEAIELLKKSKEVK
ncbi:MAG: hypothetical protein V1732_02235 [Patescibacteria group bacterium]|nr:hypothetical protein [Patescibacteria group bacterium]